MHYMFANTMSGIKNKQGFCYSLTFLLYEKILIIFIRYLFKIHICNYFYLVTGTDGMLLNG
jgi:hypothetical protein